MSWLTNERTTFQHYFNIDLRGILRGTLHKKMNLQMRYENFSFVIDNDQNQASSWLRWMGRLTMGITYNRGDSTYGWMMALNWEHFGVSAHHLGFEKNLTGFKFKAKIDSMMNTAISCDTSVGERINLSFGLGLSLLRTQESEFWGNLSNFGLKVQILD